MGKDLSEIEDAYRESYELITDEFSKKVREGKDRSKARIDYRKKFHKILKKRNRAYLIYVKNHKEELLGMPEKKKKKAYKKEVYKAYHIDFRETFFQKTKKIFNKMFFNLSLFFKKVRYNFIPSWMKFFVFRLALFFKSIWLDVSLFIRGIKLNAFRVFNRHFEIIKEKVLVVVNKIKDKFNEFSEWNKARVEAKKKRKEEALLKKEEEEKAKKKAEEEEKKSDEEK